jgi:hypothetical protein
MDNLECPSIQLWNERRDWFEKLADPPGEWGGYLLGEQSCALSADVQSAFCAGAWLAVILLSLTVIDTHLREVEAPDFKGSTKKLLDMRGTNPRLQGLRRRRNSLIHVDTQSPAITVDQHWSDHKILEAEARSAIELMFEAVYENLCI